MTLIDDILAPQPLRLFKSKLANDALENYIAAFGDSWKEVIDSYSRLTRSEEAVLAKAMNEAVDAGTELTEGQVSKIYNRSLAELEDGETAH